MTLPQELRTVAAEMRPAFSAIMTEAAETLERRDAVIRLLEQDANEAMRAQADSQPAPAGGIPGNFITHRAAWRKALETAKAHAAADDVSYWDHELRVFDRSFDRLWALMQDNTPPTQAADSELEDAARYRFLAAHCRITGEHWGGRWSIVVEGPAPESHDSKDDFDAAIDVARAQANEGDQHG